MGNNACSVRTVFGKFPKLRTLGKGAHGIAEEVKINDKHKMAVKVQYLLDDSELDEVNQELSIMDAVTLDKSPNKDLVALYFGTCTDRDGQYDGNSMIFEFMELAEGSLESLLDKSNSQNLMKNPRQFMSIMKQVMFTMCWLVSRFDIVHNDLYPRNIVYVHTKTPKMYRLDINDETLILKVAAGEICIKIIDFGHASSTQKFD
jgi:serine/threonine protein kinase